MPVTNRVIAWNSAEEGRGTMSAKDIMTAAIVTMMALVMLVGQLLVVLLIVQEVLTK